MLLLQEIEEVDTDEHFQPKSQIGIISIVLKRELWNEKKNSFFCYLTPNLFFILAVCPNLYFTEYFLLFCNFNWYRGNSIFVWVGIIGCFWMLDSLHKHTVFNKSKVTIPTDHNQLLRICHLTKMKQWL